MKTIHTFWRSVVRLAPLCFSLFLTTAASCFAQTSGRADDRSDLRVTAQPGQPVPLPITPPGGVGGRSFSLMVIKGLSDKESLEPGMKSRDAWYVPMKDLPALKLTTSAGSARDLLISVSFMEQGGGSSPVVRIFTIHTGPSTGQNGQKAVPRSVDGRSADGNASSNASPSLSAGEEQKSLAEGQELMKNGDVAAARLLFEDLALQGSAKGAVAMGQSYDPEVLARMNVQGLTPDLEKAKQWYAKARQMK